MGTGKWQTVSSRTAHINPWYGVRHDSVIRPDGGPGDYFVVETKYPGVLVIPYDGERVYLVEQHRYPVDQKLWSFPAGHSNSGNALAEAKRELKEETGFEATSWDELGTIAPGPGWSSATVTAFLARGLHGGTPEREASEADMRMRGFTKTELTKLLRTSPVHDGLLTGALPLLLAKHSINLLDI